VSISSLTAKKISSSLCNIAKAEVQLFQHILSLEAVLIQVQP
jgi:hypothetical protein